VLRARATVRYAIDTVDINGKEHRHWYDLTTPRFESGNDRTGRAWQGRAAWFGREYDAEAKVYQYIWDELHNIEDFISRTIVYLSSEEGPCSSCRAIRGEFKSMFTGEVFVNTLSGQRTYTQTIKNRYLIERYGTRRIVYGHQRYRRVRRASSSPTRFETTDSMASPLREE
jgi:hypothetical protein